MNHSVSLMCECHPPKACVGLKFCSSKIGCYYSVHLNVNQNSVVQEYFNCLYDDNVSKNLDLCNKNSENLITQCCYIGNFCNKAIANRFRQRFYATSYQIFLALAIPLSIFFIGLVFILIYWLIRIKKERKNHKIKSYDLYLNTLDKLTLQNNKSPSLFYQEDCDINVTNATSGSGSGIPFLVQRTIARQIRLLCCIGKGRFGEVWKGVFRNEYVAVKLFSSRDESSWARETNIYNIGLLNHDNLLSFIASDMISKDDCTQLWLVTAYHEKGSLFDNLQFQTFDYISGLVIARSCFSGICFLHTEIFGTILKPSIAHRDIKSKNILLKSNGEACIADLGLATSKNSDQNQGSLSYPSQLLYDADTCALLRSETGPIRSRIRVGTKRYMAPEILANVSESDLNENDNSCFDFISIYDESCQATLPHESYLNADIYAMSLVIWEILRRTKGLFAPDEDVEPYKVPFWNVVSPDPSFNAMRDLVVRGIPEIPEPYFDIGEREILTIREGNMAWSRPLISKRWTQDEYFARIVQTMIECWAQDPSDRLTALRAEKNLQEIEDQVRNSKYHGSCENWPQHLMRI